MALLKRFANTSENFSLDKYHHDMYRRTNPYWPPHDTVFLTKKDLYEPVVEFPKKLPKNIKDFKISQISFDDDSEEKAKKLVKTPKNVN